MADVLPGMMFQLVVHGVFLCGSSSSDLPKKELCGPLVDTCSDKGGGGEGGGVNGGKSKDGASDFTGDMDFLVVEIKTRLCGVIGLSCFSEDGLDEENVLPLGDAAPSTDVLLTFCVSSFFLIL